MGQTGFCKVLRFPARICGFLQKPAPPKFRGRPPGLINHVLTVLVFRSWVLAMPPPPELHPGASKCAPGLAFAFMALRANSWICCPQPAYHPCKDGTQSTCFCSTRGHAPRNSGKFGVSVEFPQKSPVRGGEFQKIQDAAFLLTVGSFLLTVELFCLQLGSGASLLRVGLF